MGRQFFVLLLSLVILAGVAVVAAMEAGDEFQVNNYTTGQQQFLSVGMDSDGDFVIAWSSDGQDGDLSGVYAQRYDSSGSPVGGEFQVNTYTTSSQGYPSVGMDSDGDFVIAWMSDGQDGDLWGLYAQRYDSSGNTVGSEFQVNTYTTHHQQYPSVGMDSDGDFVITWMSSGQNKPYYGVYAQLYNNSGSKVGGEFQVNTYTAASQSYPSVEMDDNGNFVIVWSNYGQDGSVFGVYAQRYDSSGSKVGGDFQVNTYTAANQVYPSVGMDSDGDFVIAWMSDGQDGDLYGVYAQRYDSSGSTVGGEFQVNNYTASQQRYPSVGMDSDGDFVIAWMSDGQDGDLYGVYAQRYNNSGSKVGGEFQVNNYTASNQQDPSVGMDSNGNFIIAWQSYLQDGDIWGIYARRYTLTTAATAPNATSFNISLGSTNFSGMSDFTSVSGMVLATSNGHISWNGNVNADSENYDSYVVIGDGFVSVDTANLHSTINQSANISLAVDNCDDTSIYYASGAFVAADEVRNQDTLCTSNTDPACSDVVCAGGRLNFTASHFTGFAAGSNANLTIWDGAEGSSQDCDTVVDVYANYTNKTSGDFITGADCNVSFSDDGYSAVYGMEEQGQVYHNDSKSFSLAGTYFYNVTCDHPNFNRLSALDNITIQGVLCDGGEPAPIPEFSTIGIIFVIVLSIFGTSLIVRKKK